VPYHIGNKVHPPVSFAAYYPDLVPEWHLTKNALRPDQVTRAPGEMINWICDLGHVCDRMAQRERAKLARERSCERADARAEAHLPGKADRVVVIEDDVF
jgi:hypothetical protein